VKVLKRLLLVQSSLQRSGEVGVEGLHLDTADTVTFGDGESDVSLVSPGGVPGVLDSPVLGSVLGAPSDNKDGVVEVGTALGSVVEDTGRVVLEVQSVGLNSNGDGSLGESGLESVGVGGGDGSIAGGEDVSGLADVVSASFALPVMVGVGSLEVGGVGLPVVEGGGLGATVAT